ncbi:MAG: 23S rRNA (adenine(2503)-C(2))-methyltransferase RlmN [Candidatus Azobacteroides sp.]|nr:23S rRNA (adenine(2503)-C(2))-methyltransferase RlmN [Candidatus Azobacteroides sp.]
MEFLIGKTLDELERLVAQLEMPRFTARQIAGWLYQKKVSSIEEMTNISLVHRKRLIENYSVGRNNCEQKQESVDGTIKYLFPAFNQQWIESVYIPEKERATLCISSQAGCKMNCLFCMTGKQGFSGQLTAGDMLNQILSLPETDSLTNVVFMGMGEPLDNVDELLKTLEILTSDYGFAWSPKRITVSTVGILPGLKRLLEESKVHLAVSLHSPYPAERLSLAPVEKAYPLTEILDRIKQYDFSHQRRVSFEYILFGGLNDDLRHAIALSKLLKDIPCRVNLIHYHPVPGIHLSASNPKTMVEFRDCLNDRGIVATIRASRGEDILAACGMLSTEGMNRKS